MLRSPSLSCWPVCCVTSSLCGAVTVPRRKCMPGCWTMCCCFLWPSLTVSPWGVYSIVSPKTPKRWMLSCSTWYAGRPPPHPPAFPSIPCPLLALPPLPAVFLLGLSQADLTSPPQSRPNLDPSCSCSPLAACFPSLPPIFCLPAPALFHPPPSFICQLIGRLWPGQLGCASL